MNVLQLHFIGRSSWISFDVDDEILDRVRRAFESEPTSPLGFWELQTRQGQHLWVNAERISMVRYLYEPKQFTPLVKQESKQYSDIDPDGYADISWDVKLWLAGREHSIDLNNLDGHAWVTLTTGVHFPRPYVTIADEDEEDITLKVPFIDVFCGIETDRFSGDYLPVLNAEIYEEEKTA